MVPADANFMGNVFGGSVLSEVDRVAYVCAMRHSGQVCVTASLDRVDFLAPVHVGDLVQFDGRLTGVGRSSMEVLVEVTAEQAAGGARRPVGRAFVTMVAVDRDGRPTAVPELLVETEEERREQQAAQARMAARVASRSAANARPRNRYEQENEEHAV